MITNGQGKFALMQLDPDLVFRLLVVAEGYVPTYSAKSVDPKKGAITLALKVHDLDRRDPELVLRGRVLDDKGRPVVRARIEPFGFQKGSSGQYGGLKGFDALAVSDARGDFRLGVPEKGLTLCLEIKAADLAPRIFPSVPVRSEVHELRLDPGVTVSGQVVKDGKPLASVSVGLAGADRSAGKFVGHFEISTNERGEFTFLHVPAQTAYFVYGLMDTCHTHGALPAKRVKVGVSETIAKLGTLSVEPGYRLQGKVVLSDGKPVPPQTPVFFSREEAWDHQTVIAGADGSFSFSGLPPEKCSLTARVPGYHVSSRNESIDPLNPFQLVGTMQGHIRDLVLMLEPGAAAARDSAKTWREQADEYERRRNGPLRGAPAKVNISP